MRRRSDAIAVVTGACAAALGVIGTLAAAEGMQPRQVVAQSAPKTEPAAVSDTSCGFVKLQGLAIRAPSIKCETSERTHNEGGTVDVVALTVRLVGKNEFATVVAQKDRSAWGWKAMHGDQILENARRWAASRLVGEISSVTGGSFRHVRFTMKDGATNWSCAYGNVTGSVLARGNEGYKHTARITYCEIGTHSLNDSDVSRIQTALSMN